MTAAWPAGYNVTRFESAGSTNDLAKDAAKAEGPDGAVFWTPHQTTGRGTHGREWATPPGNLAVSILKRPQMPIRFAPQAALVTAVALADALCGMGLAPSRVKLKWPNDVMVDGCKVSGILVEGQAAGHGVDWLVVGTGVNVLHHPAETRHPATNLAEAGFNTSIEEVLHRYLTAFETWWSRWQRYDFQVIQTAWTARTKHVLGEQLQLLQGRQMISARYKRLSPEGALVVEGPDGVEIQIVSGEVFADPTLPLETTD
jgi:BirA family transcriptional regulator, biotin operon repressor / biotin---[acetyl-CoA-carboxylase] ligase